MALLNRLKSLGTGAGSLLLGQQAGDVELGEDAEKRRRLQQQLLEAQAERALDGEPSRATRTAADEAIARLRGGIRSRVASAGGGPAGLLAARQGAGQEVAGRTAIERGVTQAAEQGEASQLEALSRGLVGARQAAALDEEERERKRRKGLLPGVTAGLGSLFGPVGAQLGGVAGQAVLKGIGR